MLVAADMAAQQKQEKLLGYVKTARQNGWLRRILQVSTKLQNDHSVSRPDRLLNVG